MAPSPAPQIPSPTPFTPTPSLDTASFASVFATMSDNFDGTTAPPGALSSAISSLLSASSASAASIVSSRQSAISSQRASQTATFGTSLTTSTKPAPTSDRTSETATASSSTTESSGSSSTAANSAGLQKDANSGLPSGIQAAIAVPIVVGVLVIAALVFLCIRRRKRIQPKAPLEKSPAAAKGSKKWSRHLRIFSFDTELLMGGRFSSTNSIRSHQTGSIRSGGSRQGHGQTPSVHSVDEVAPPYRDAITAARPPSSVARAMTGAAGAGARGSGVDRNASVSTGPPPYGPGQNRDLISPITPTSVSNRNPFGDNNPISPVEASPFNDPPGTSPAMSRNSSFYHGRDDASSVAGGSDAGSIRQATLVRNASVMSGGRVINDVSRP